MGHYVGARYVPKFANPLEWAENTAYEAMTVVSYNNNSYTSKVPVPPTVGNPANNPQYWALTGNYNAQVEQYRQETENYNAQVEEYRRTVVDLENTLPVIFDNIDDLKNGNLPNDRIAITNGFYTTGDNGGAMYKIVDTATENNIDTFKLNNGNYAVFIGATKRFCVDCFGAKPDNDDFDNSTIINYVLTNYKTAKLFGHYYIKHTVTVNVGELLTTDGVYKKSYAYMGKSSGRQVYSFENLDGVLYTNNSFSDTKMVSINGGSVCKILVTNISATPNNIYTPSFDGICVEKTGGNLDYASASGCNKGILINRAAGNDYTELTGSACIDGIYIIGADNKFVNLSADTNIHMNPKITPTKGTGGYFSENLAGIVVYGGNNQFTNVRSEWCYYGIIVTAGGGNTFTNVLMDWNYDGICYFSGPAVYDMDIWTNVRQYVQEYYVYIEHNENQVFMTGCSFKTSDGSAGHVTSGDNVKPTGTPLRIYPKSGSGCFFTITASDLSESTTKNDGDYTDYVSYNPFSRATIACCKLNTALNVSPDGTYIELTGNYASR